MTLLYDQDNDAHDVAVANEDRACAVCFRGTPLRFRKPGRGWVPLHAVCNGTDNVIAAAERFTGNDVGNPGA